MPDEPPSACPPDSENNTPEAPATRPVPLTAPDRADTGCFIGLFGIFVGVFLMIALLARAGAVLIIAVLAAFLLAILTPMINPAERMAEKAKWWGRAITFIVLCALVSGGFLYVWYRANRAPVEEAESYGE